MMPGTFSRRDFLAGVLATGTLSAAATYLAGGRSLSSVTLNLVTGEDSTGARDLLISMWNQVNPHTRVDVEVVKGGTGEQKSAMVSSVKSSKADILNLDIIHVAHFQAEDLISPVDIGADEEFLPILLTPSRLGNDGSDQHWAAPFNADVGMLFERPASDKALPGELGLAQVIDRVEDGSPSFAGQLKSTSSSTREALTVNVLEHAVSRDAKFLDAESWTTVPELERWQAALEPMRVAVERKRIMLCDGEEDTRDRFREGRLPYMRNWPVEYRELLRSSDPDARAAQINVRPLPEGILGGQSLALAENGANKARAVEVIHFLTSGLAQKILASYGLAPVKHEAYADDALETFIPHLMRIKGAVEHARLRPLHRNYDAASHVIETHSKRLLEQGEDLTTQFIEQLQDALG